jgi:hypothetical protein
MPNREANRLFRRVIGYGNLLCGPVMIVGQDRDEFTDVPSAVAEMVRLGSADALARSVRPS